MDKTNEVMDKTSVIKLKQAKSENAEEKDKSTLEIVSSKPYTFIFIAKTTKSTLCI